MKKAILILISTFFPLMSFAQMPFDPPTDLNIADLRDSATLSWQDPKSAAFDKSILFRSTIPIEKYFTYEAVDKLCEKIYEGRDGIFTSTGLAENLPYYFILFSVDKAGNYSDAVIIQKDPLKNAEETKKTEETKSLIGATSETVNQVSFTEAGIVYNYNKKIETPTNQDSQRLALFIMVKSPHDLTERDKNAISYFIDAGTPTTIVLGAGERTGVLNSYLSVFDKLPRSTLEWQDVIKIANGRWPDEHSIEAEKEASENSFAAIYQRKPDMGNPNDSAAVTVIAYGLRPADRNMESEAKAIEIYKGIFRKAPVEAHEWDLVRAIAYSGATR